MNGLYAGFDYNVPVTENIGIAPGIYYNFSSGVANNLINLPKLGGLLKGRLDEHYIDIPVNFNFSIPFQGNRAFIYAGPTFSCGLSSKIKADASILGINIKGDVLDLYDSKVFERFDVMLGGGIGADISNIVRVTVGYNWGAFNRIGGNTNLSESGEDNISSNLGKLIKDNAKVTRSMAHIGVAVLF